MVSFEVGKEGKVLTFEGIDMLCSSISVLMKMETFMGRILVDGRCELEIGGLLKRERKGAS